MFLEVECLSLACMQNAFNGWDGSLMREGYMYVCMEASNALKIIKK